MKSDPKMSGKHPLDPAEWNFRSPDDGGELPDRGVHGCFFYEYARSCQPMVETVELFRKESLDDEHRKIFVWSYDLVIYLAGLQEFPDVPWVKLKKIDGRDVSRYFQRMVQVPIMLRGDRRLSWELHEGPAKRRHRVTRFEEKGPKTMFTLELDWRCSDSEIKEDFAQLLEDYRPETYDHPEGSKKRSFSEHVLPFEKRSALEWLGVLRRKNNGISWSEFVKRYPKSGDAGSAKRLAQEQARKAKVILEWFARGGQLVSCNKGRTLRRTEGTG